MAHHWHCVTCSGPSPRSATALRGVASAHPCYRGPRWSPGPLGQRHGADRDDLGLPPGFSSGHGARARWAGGSPRMTARGYGTHYPCLAQPRLLGQRPLVPWPLQVCAPLAKAPRPRLPRALGTLRVRWRPWSLRVGIGLTRRPQEARANRVRSVRGGGGGGGGGGSGAAVGEPSPPPPSASSTTES